MVKLLKEMRHEIRENVRGGNGALAMMHLFEQDELNGKGKMIARFTIEKGQSIGKHVHEEDGELYIIISGEGIVDDNGIQRIVMPGDAVWTANGEFHSITNAKDEPLLLYAIVIC